MNAPESVLAMRRRSGWEACDSGILLWRKNWPALLLFFGVPTGIAAAALGIVLSNQLALAGFIIWWLAPFFDRFALHVVGVRFFDGDAPFKSLFSGLGRHLFKGLFGDLLWRRFSPFRSARMPLVVLEGLKGKELKRRRASLRLGFGFPLTVICLLLNSVLLGGEILFIYGIFELVQPGFLDGANLFDGFSPLLLVLAWVNKIFVETLFVCMGFGIYINARVETEGWDIELLFRQCVEKAKKVFAAAIFILAFLFVPLSEVRAETEVEEYRFEESSKIETEVAEYRYEGAAKTETEALEKVLQNEDFGKEVPTKKIEFKKPAKKRPQRDWGFELPPWLREVVALILRTMLILAITLALVFLVRFILKRRAQAEKEKTGAKITQKTAEAADPRALLDEAAALYDSGRLREAWASCFKAFAAAFRKNWRIAIPAEATEYETLRLARRFAGTSIYISDFEAFVRRWVNFAYGGIAPGSADFGEARAACAELIAEMPAASGGRK